MLTNTSRNRGFLYQQQGLYSDAINDFDTAIDKKENYGETYYRRGQSNYDLNQMEEVLTDFAEAIRLKPGFFDAYFQRGLVLQELKIRTRTSDAFLRDVWDDIGILLLMITERLGYPTQKPNINSL